MKVNKFRKAIQIVKILLKHPKRISGVISYSEMFRDYCIEKYNMPNGPPLAGIFDIVDEVDISIDPFISNFVGSDLMTMAFMKSVAKQYDDCKFLEIGTYHGVTTQNMDEVTSGGVTIDIIEHDRNLMKPSCRIERVIEDSRCIPWDSLGKFSLIYVDGSHHYDTVKTDTESAFKCLAPGGTILFDDITDKSKAYNHPWWLRWAVIAGVYDGCPEDKRDRLYLVSNMCNIIYTEKEIPERGEFADYLVKVGMKIEKI